MLSKISWTRRLFAICTGCSQLQTIGYAEILSALRGEGPGWEQTFPHQLQRLRRVLTDELLTCVNLGKGCSPPQGFTLRQFQESMWAVRKNPRQPKHLRDAVQELDAACGIYLASARRPMHPPEFGRICAYCWRNEEGRFASHKSPYGLCHLHKAAADPALDKLDPGNVIFSPADLDERRRRNTARRAVTHSKALLGLKIPELFSGNVGHRLRRYPVYSKSRNQQVMGENWCRWVQQQYPLFFQALQLIDRTDVLVDPVKTIYFLEARELTTIEITFYKGEAKEASWISGLIVEQYSNTFDVEHLLGRDLIMQSIWELPVAKCDAWLNLEKIYSGQKGRDPDYQGLLLLGSPP